MGLVSQTPETDAQLGRKTAGSGPAWKPPGRWAEVTGGGPRRDSQAAPSLSVSLNHPQWGLRVRDTRAAPDPGQSPQPCWQGVRVRGQSAGQPPRPPLDGPEAERKEQELVPPTGSLAPGQCSARPTDQPAALPTTRPHPRPQGLSGFLPVQTQKPHPLGNMNRTQRNPRTMAGVPAETLMGPAPPRPQAAHLLGLLGLHMLVQEGALQHGAHDGQAPAGLELRREGEQAGVLHVLLGVQVQQHQHLGPGGGEALPRQLSIHQGEPVFQGAAPPRSGAADRPPPSVVGPQIAPLTPCTRRPKQRSDPR